MTVREYQDNIKDVLFLEEIVEGLEKDFSDLSQEKELVEKRRTNIENRIKEAPVYQKRMNKKYLLSAAGVFSGSTFLGYRSSVIDLKLNVLLLDLEYVL